MNIEDQPTKQLRTPAEPGDKVIDLTDDRASTGDDRTEVLSLDNLLGPGQPTEPAEPVPPVAPIATRPKRRSLAARLRGDAEAVYRRGWTRGRQWAGAGDNALIVATIALTLLLILTVAAL